jgi:predicted permease
VLEQLAAVLAPTLVATAIGWAWGRFGPGLQRDALTELIMRIGAPCLAFHGLISAHVAPLAMLRMAGVTALSLACFGALGAAALSAARLPLRTFLAPVVFANTGNMGLPLSLFAFGEPGLALALCVYAVAAVTQYSIGIALWSGELSVQSMLRTPLTVAVLLAVAVIASGWSVPTWIANTTQLLGSFAVPLMLLNLGVAISELQVTRLRRTAGIALLRLGLGVSVGFALAALLDLDRVARGVLVVQCSMPIAVFNYLLAQRYGRSPDEVAAAIVLSTLLSFALLPALLLHLLPRAI